jgi:methionine aminotransferase
MPFRADGNCPRVLRREAPYTPRVTIASKLPTVQTSIFAVMSRLAEQCGALNLGQGFPDFEPPAELLDALARHSRAGKNQYAPMAGVARLREQIAKKLERDYGRALDPESELTVTSGATEGIFDVVTALIRPGDEAIVLDPAVRLQGGVAVHVPLRDDFSVDWQRLRERIGPKTRLVFLNFPHNPSGAILSPEDLVTLAEVLRASEALILSDEVYEHLVFDGREQQSMLRSRELYERSFTVGSFGKAYHATGWKVGWVAAPPALSAELRKVHQFVTFSTSTAAQHAFADVLERDDGHLRNLAAFYAGKRDRFRSLLEGSRFSLLPVHGAYFQLADYSALSQEDDVTFSRRLALEASVVSIPISVFYESPPARRLVRFCFAKTDATLERAAESLRNYAPILRS